LTLNTHIFKGVSIYLLALLFGWLCIFLCYKKEKPSRRTTFTFCHLVREPDVFVYRIRNLLSDSLPKHIVVVGLVGEKLFPAEHFVPCFRLDIYANDIESRIGKKKRESWREIAFFFVIDSLLFFCYCSHFQDYSVFFFYLFVSILLSKPIRHNIILRPMPLVISSNIFVYEFFITNTVVFYKSVISYEPHR
jgi:hypothetical protein